MTYRIVISFLTLALAASSGFAQGKGKGGGKGKGQGGANAANVGVQVIFSSQDQRILRDYYLVNRGTPSGLPPGLAKNVARGKPLPPGWAKKVAPFPLQLERQLPPLPPYTRRGFIDGQVVLFDDRTQTVLDAFGVF